MRFPRTPGNASRCSTSSKTRPRGRPRRLRRLQPHPRAPKRWRHGAQDGHGRTPGSAGLEDDRARAKRHAPHHRRLHRPVSHCAFAWDHSDQARPAYAPNPCWGLSLLPQAAPPNPSLGQRQRVEADFALVNGELLDGLASPTPSPSSRSRPEVFAVLPHRTSTRVPEVPDSVHVLDRPRGAAL
jgi:hypothetical protein